MKKLSTLFSFLLTFLASGVQAQEPVDYSTSANSTKNQVVLSLKDGSKKYYNTESVSSIDFSGSNVTVKQTAGDYTFENTVSGIAFNKAIKGQVKIIEAKGWLESAYVKFEKLTGATSYNVYVKGGQYADYTKIDAQLVRDYGTYGRADAMGLKAGENYAIKVVPTNDEKVELTDNASEATDIVVKSYNRDGYAHYNATAGIGAYNNDGTLKANARVIYITKANAKTVTLEMQVDNKGKMETRTGIQDIIQAYEKGVETRPLAIRIIGLLKMADMPELGSSAIGLQVKGKGQNMNLTIEGVGSDATFHGFGVLVRACKYVELRNLGVMMHEEDGISFDTDNEHVWGHNLDIFYGKNKGGDKAKGDGSFDVKGTFYCTVSDNHFWDSGKCNLNSNGDEVDYVTYHHNWYDHSDSRHPRVRKSKHLHVFNNYFDGNSKYGVGSTTGSNIFVEKNYYRNCKYPMLISKQGSDINNGVGSSNDTKGTFSSEDGGIIKAFDNYMEGQKRFQPYNASDATNSIHFDAYLAQTRDEQVPATVTALQGGATYNNFDTADDFYQYNPDDKESVPTVVTGAYGAGRCEHGDFQWTFDNATEDTNYEVITALSDALMNYNSSLVGIFGDESSTTPGGDEPGGDVPGGDEPGGDEPTPTPEGTIECSFANGAATNSFFTTEGSKKDYKNSAITYNGNTYTQAWNCNSSGKISFTTTKAMKLTIGLTTKKNEIGIDGTAYTGTAGTGYYEVVVASLAAGSHTIAKANGETHVFYIKLEPTE